VLSPNCGKINEVTVLDTAVASLNLGDQIIMEAVDRELEGILPSSFLYRVATHEIMGARSRKVLGCDMTNQAGRISLA